MPTGLSVLCLIHPDSSNLIIWFRSPEQSRSQRHSLTRERKASRQQSPQFCWQGQYIWHDLCTSVIQYYSLGTCLTAMVKGEKGLAQHSWAFDMVLNVPDPSVVNFDHLSSDSTWYHHNFYWSGVVALMLPVILITPLSSLSCWIPCLSTTQDAACPAI